MILIRLVTITLVRIAIPLFRWLCWINKVAL